MKRIKSKQQSVRFMFIASPCTIDKTRAWGEGNRQDTLNGAFLKVNDDGITISHLIQPNKDKSAPIGWEKTEETGLFNKLPIWIDEKIYTKGIVKLNTADGEMNLNVNEPSQICYGDINGKPDHKNIWMQTVKELEENYYL